MAQALDERVPPFILQVFGTNGKFTASDTVRRWHYEKLELQKYVNIFGFVCHYNLFYLKFFIIFFIFRAFFYVNFCFVSKSAIADS